MEIRQIQYFLAVAELLNFSRAAEYLHVTQPTLSQQISSLEDDLGVVLLIRSTRSVSLTDIGKQFKDQAQLLIDEWNKLGSIVGRYRLNKKTVLKIALFPMAKFSKILPLVKEFINDHPEITTEICFPFSGDVDIYDRVNCGDIDIAFVENSSLTKGTLYETVFRKNLAQFQILHDPMYVLLNCADPLAEKTSVSKKDLEGYRIVCDKESGHNSFPRIEKVFLDAGVTLGSPLTFTHSPELLATLIDSPTRASFLGKTFAQRLEESFPNLAARPLQTRKKVDVFMIMRNREEEYAAVTFYEYMVNRCF